jgi:hypothetical protein
MKAATPAKRTRARSRPSSSGIVEQPQNGVTAPSSVPFTTAGQEPVPTQQAREPIVTEPALQEHEPTVIGTNSTSNVASRLPNVASGCRCARVEHGGSFRSWTGPYGTAAVATMPVGDPLAPRRDRSRQASSRTTSMRVRNPVTNSSVPPVRLTRTADGSPAPTAQAAPGWTRTPRSRAASAAAVPGTPPRWRRRHGPPAAGATDSWGATG